MNQAANHDDRNPGSSTRSIAPRFGRWLSQTRQVVATVMLCLASVASSSAQSTNEMLRLLGVDDQHLSAFVDGRPLAADENEALLRILFAANRFDSLHLHRGIRNDVSLDDLAAQPGTFRGEVFQLRGRVTRVEVEEPAAADATRFEMPQFYRCTVQLEPSDLQAIVYTTTVPSEWAAGADDLDEPVSFVGFFIKTVGEAVDMPQSVFVTSRLAWHPRTTLGNLGMDVGLFDTVTDRTGIKRAERECFYQMLSAAGRADTSRLDRLTQDDYPAAPLFNSPELQRGRLVGLRGVARRITKIIVEDPDIIERLGIDHYYEVAVFTDDSQGNPIIFCVRDLPEGMPVGDGISEVVRIPAFFLKAWTFETAQLHQQEATDADPSRQGQHLRQVAPLLMGKMPHWYVPPSDQVPGISGWVAGSLFLLALAGVWYGVWRRHVADKSYADGTLARAREPEDATLDTTAIEKLDSEEPVIEHD